jgi:hypothetical protein
MTNPYLPQMAQAVTDQSNQNWRQNLLPSINSGSLANNNFGSNRHAIAQGVGAANVQTGLNNTIAGMNMNAWDSDQNRANQASMQSAALANQMAIAKMNDSTQRDLGFGGLDFNYWNAGNNFGLQNKSLDQGFYNANRGMDLQQMGLGANLMNQGNLGLSNAGQGLWNMGQQQQQQGFQPFQQFGSLLGQFSGMGGQNSTTQPGGSTLGGAVGGAMTLAQLWQLLGGGR